MAYYIGVDGGGTKTAYALFNENKEMLFKVRGPGSNHENMENSFTEASAIIWDGLMALCKEAGISLEDVDFTLMGLAGIDHVYQHDIMCGMLREKGLRRFEIFNDGFIVVKAGSETGAAIGYNCGTGVCCNAIDSEGKMLQLAGLGNFSGDYCGGIYIAEQTFRMAYDDIFACGEKTVISQRLMDYFKLSDRFQFLDILANLESEKADDYIRVFIDMFFEAVEEGDKPALEVVKIMAHRGALFISGLAKQMTFSNDEIEVVLSGSINVKLANPTYLRLLKEEAARLSGRKLKFINLEKPPVTGCVNWILQDFA